MLLILFPRSLIVAAVRPEEGTLPLLLVIDVVTLVAITIRPGVRALTIHFI